MVGPSLLQDITRTHTGDPDLILIIFWCSDPFEVIGVTELFAESQFTEHLHQIFIPIFYIHKFQLD